MLTEKQVVEIKVMSQRGMSIREMARQLGCSRNKVRRYMHECGAPVYGPSSPRATKLDPFKGLEEGDFEAWLDPALVRPEAMLGCLPAAMLVAGTSA